MCRHHRGQRKTLNATSRISYLLRYGSECIGSMTTTMTKIELLPNPMSRVTFDYRHLIEHWLPYNQCSAMIIALDSNVRLDFLVTY